MKGRAPADLQRRCDFVATIRRRAPKGTLMKLTTKGRYAVQAMADIAAAGKDQLVSLPDVAERQGISAGYLEQLFAKLRRAGLVASVRGVAGGYRLGRGAGALPIPGIIAAPHEG